MGIFSLTQELAIDLGTANTLIIYNGKVVVDEPSIVALDVHTGKLVAIGQQARQMHEKTNPNIKTIRPASLRVRPTWRFVPCAIRRSTPGAARST